MSFKLKQRRSLPRPRHRDHEGALWWWLPIPKSEKGKTHPRTFGSAVTSRSGCSRAYGFEELQAFQDHLGPQGYQHIVVEPSKCLIVFKDPTYNEAPHWIGLVKYQGHYDGLTSIPALLNRSYYCRHCDQGYNTQDAQHHNCEGQNCDACLPRPRHRDHEGALWWWLPIPKSEKGKTHPRTFGSAVTSRSGCSRAYGFEELQAFQDHLGPQGYQHIVVEPSKCLIVFKDPTYNEAPHWIGLVKYQGHYDGLTSIPALLNRSYYCRYCDQGYNTQDARHHNCEGQNCDACCRTNNSCPNFATWVKPSVYCPDCNGWFYGQDCFQAH